MHPKAIRPLFLIFDWNVEHEWLVYVWCQWYCGVVMVSVVLCRYCGVVMVSVVLWCCDGVCGTVVL